MRDSCVRTLPLEYVESNGAGHIRKMHIEIWRHKPDTPELAPPKLHAAILAASEAVMPFELASITTRGTVEYQTLSHTDWSRNGALHDLRSGREAVVARQTT